MSRTVTEAVPRVMRAFAMSPDDSPFGRVSGMPSRTATSLTASGPTVVVRSTKAELTELAVAWRRSMSSP